MVSSILLLVLGNTFSGVKSLFLCLQISLCNSLEKGYMTNFAAGARPKISVEKAAIIGASMESLSQGLWESQFPGPQANRGRQQSSAALTLPILLRSEAVFRAATVRKRVEGRVILISYPLADARGSE